MARKPSTTAERAFSPALNAAINLLFANTERAAQQIIGEEAACLTLPAGWTADLQRRVWIIKT